MVAWAPSVGSLLASSSASMAGQSDAPAWRREMGVFSNMVWSPWVVGVFPRGPSGGRQQLAAGSSRRAFSSVSNEVSTASRSRALRRGQQCGGVVVEGLVQLKHGAFAVGGERDEPAPCVERVRLLGHQATGCHGLHGTRHPALLQAHPRAQLRQRQRPGAAQLGQQMALGAGGAAAVGHHALGAGVQAGNFAQQAAGRGLGHLDVNSNYAGACSLPSHWLSIATTWAE